MLRISAQTALLLGAGLFWGCAPQGPSTETEDPVAPAVELVSNECLWTGLVSKDTPDSCELDGNSPVSSEIRHVPGLGFMDGMSCEAWPRSLLWSELSDVINGDLPNTAITHDAIWFQQRAHQAEVDEWIVFGSKRELNVRNVPWTWAGEGQTRAVAADLDAGYGTLLDHAWTCSQSDERDGLCRARIGNIEGRQVRILERSEPSNAKTRSLMLTAESVRFHESVELDVNLAVMASEVVGGPRPGKRRRQERSGEDEKIVVKVQNGGLSIGPSWAEARSALEEEPPPPILAVFASTVEGVAEFRTKTRAPVAKLELVTNAVPLGESHQGPNQQRLVQATIAGAVPRQLAWSLEQSMDNDGDITFFHNAALQFGRPPNVRGSIGGGATQLTTVKPADAAVWAQGESRLSVSWTQSAIVEFADALAAQLDSISPNCVNAGTPGQTCWMEMECWYYPDGSDDCGEYEVCQDNPPNSACHARGSLTLSSLSGPVQQVPASATQQELSAAIAAVVQAVLADHYPQPNGPAKLPAGHVRKELGFEKTHFAAHVGSQGIFFDVLYDAADNRSRRHGLPAHEWASLRDATSTQVLIPAMTPQEYGLDRMRWSDVQRRGIYVKTFDKDSSVHLNGINQPYGRIAQGWHPSRLAPDEAYTSMIELSTRWADVTQLAQELDQVADDQDFLDVLNSLISLTESQVGLTQSSAEQLAEAASQNSADQAAAIQRLAELSTAIAEQKSAYEAQMVSAWGCTAGFASCDAAVAQLASELSTHCDDDEALGGFASLLSTLSNVLGTVVPGISAVSDVVSNPQLISFFEQVAGVAGGSSGSAQQIKDGIDWIKDRKDNIKTARKVVDGALSLTKKVSAAIATIEPNCEGTPIENQLTQLRVDLATAETVTALFDAQLAQLEGVLLSFSAHFEHLLTSAHALQMWAQGSANIQQELSALSSNTMAQQEKQARFIKAACETTQLAASRALADYKAISDTLVTASGRAQTPPHLAIPRSPALQTTLTADRKDGFAMSVWDQGLFSAFNESGGLGATPFLTDARARFAEHVSEEMCRLGPSPLVQHLFLVRKTITGEAFDEFLSSGRLFVNVTLQDVLDGGDASGANLSATESLDGFGQSIALSGPVLLSMGYSACVGTGDEPCCTGRGCREGFSDDQPHLVLRQSAIPTLSCQEDTIEAQAEQQSTGADIHTCLATVAHAPAHGELDYVSSPHSANSLLIEDHVDDLLCNVAPEALPLKQMRGVPAIGTYEFAPNAAVASAMSRSLLDGPSQGASNAWFQNHANMTGLELFFFVGAEGLAQGAVYEVQ